MKTSWFSFGQNHTHRINGRTLDCDHILEITAEDPRAEIVRLCGQTWSMEYDKIPDMKWFPGGIIKLEIGPS